MERLFDYELMRIKEGEFRGLLNLKKHPLLDLTKRPQLNLRR